jgi:translation initiation factor IF-3
VSALKEQRKNNIKMNLKYIRLEGGVDSSDSRYKAAQKCCEHGNEATGYVARGQLN